ncbi:MAG: NADPH:quinone oxidoreductase family protein [Rhizobiaceae bacterium]|nr:NADPH:quinone oxidoreductase family protein [Rhizobiaceae bacterium]
MKAVRCHAFGPLADLRIEEVEDPTARPGEVVVRVVACGVNYYDGLAAEGRYQTKPPFPFSPGGEVSGVIEAIGDGVTNVAPGRKVIAFTGFGGYAEKVVVPAGNVFTAPESMDDDEAAGFLIAYATSHHALKDRAALRPGETLLVLGAAGGVGLTAVELGREMGARVIAAASSAEKLTLAKAYGAAETIDYSEEDLRERVKALTGGRGVDVVYDPVGGKQAETALKCLATGGRHLVIGFASGDIPNLAFNQLLLKQVSVTGVLWGAFARAEPKRNAENVAELLRWHAAGRLRPHISEAYPLDRFGEALDRVMSRKAKGKVVIRVGSAVAEMPARKKAETVR